MSNDAPLETPADQNRRGAWDDAIRVFLFFLCGFWLTNAALDASEGEYAYRVARNFVRTGRLGFDEPLVGVFTLAPNGRIYAAHEFGNALLFIPTAAAIEHLDVVLVRMGYALPNVEQTEMFLVSFQPGVYAALTLAIVYLILTREFGQTARQGFLGCLALGFCTYFWNFSRFLYDGMLCCLITTSALAALLKYRATGRLVFAGAAFFLLGFGVATRLSLALLVVAALGFVLFGCAHSRWKVTLTALLALAPFAAWQLWYNQLRTGNPLLSPVQEPQFAVNNALDGNWPLGVVGLLLSPGKGLFVYVPLLIASVIVFRRFWRRDRALAGFLLASAVLWLLLHGKLRSWYGAWGWGPRHMIAIVPLVCLPALVELPTLWSRRRTRMVIDIALSAGFLLACAATICDYQYRMQIAESEHRLDDATFVWGVRNQAVDMFVGAGENLRVMLGLRRPYPLESAREPVHVISNRLNIWWYAWSQQGIPLLYILTACAPLLAMLIWTGRSLLRKTEE
ncbi:MAG: glycosyltransferase family 39 protein [Planctomycetia bacterium]|nr:glycosyltransferase family 39 protein [Planctomycetia bacterium]